MIDITYHKEGDYYIPDLYLVEDEYEKNYHIGKYGHLRLEYLKKHKKADYTIMLLDGTLRKHIVDTDIQAKERLERWESLWIPYEELSEEMKESDRVYAERVLKCRGV